MARKKAVNGVPTSAPVEEVTNPSTPTDATSKGAAKRMDILAASAGIPRDVVKVNNLNMTELKNACDDAVKRLLSRPDLFIENHTHTDVKLALGWMSVLIAGCTALYGWKIEFEESKPLVLAGVVLYVLLTSLSTIYSFFVEKDIVYVGKRKLLAKRIETERLTISSHTVPPSSTSSSSHSPFAVTKTGPQPPKYSLKVSSVRSSNGGKSLLAKGVVSDVRGYNEFFDDEGTMDLERFEKWVAGLVEGVVLGEE